MPRVWSSNSAWFPRYTRSKFHRKLPYLRNEADLGLHTLGSWGSHWYPPHAQTMELHVGFVPEINPVKLCPEYEAPSRFVPKIHPVKVPKEVAISQERSRLGAPYSGVMGGPWVPTHARNMELQVGLVSEIYPVKVPQEVAISRELSRLGAPYSGVMGGPWGAHGYLPTPGVWSFKLAYFSRYTRSNLDRKWPYLRNGRSQELATVGSEGALWAPLVPGVWSSNSA
ncbi:unnamed protein product [Leuciscus chuanchicus]